MIRFRLLKSHFILSNSIYFVEKLEKMTIEQMLKENLCTVVDVRTPAEFMGGHVSSSVNIPLQELNFRMDELKQLKGPLVLCCASGNRSGMATQILSQVGVECVNGGSWMDVNYIINN